MKITYNDKTIDTNIYKQLSDNEYNEIVNQCYKKPTLLSVMQQMVQLNNGGITNSLLTEYYVKDLMFKVKLYHSKFTIEEVLEYKPLVEHFMGKTEKNKKIYPDTDTNYEKFIRVIRIAGKGVASKPSKFPLEYIDQVIQKYNINDNYYDFSCGWGDRLVSSLKNKMNYYGTDPNYLLTERLEQLTNDWRKVTQTKVIVDIRTQGSEKFIPEWENKMGLAFSSPPYFGLEDYRIGEQSYREGMEYKDWIDNYLKPTFQNIYYYLIDEGYFILNINNYGKFNLIEDSIKIAKECGFEFVEYLKLKNIQRINSNGELNDNSEKIMVFMKNGYQSMVRYGQQNIFDMLKGEEE